MLCRKSNICLLFPELLWVASTGPKYTWIIPTKIDITMWISYWTYSHNPIFAPLPLGQYETIISPFEKNNLRIYIFQGLIIQEPQISQHSEKPCSKNLYHILTQGIEPRT